MIIKPTIAPRLWFHAFTSSGAPITDLLVAGITSAAYVTIANGVRSSAATITLGSKVADTAAHSTGQLVTIHADDGWYAIDAPMGAALATADYVELVITLTDSTRLVYPTLHPIDSATKLVPTATRTELATELARIDVAISSRNATTPPTAAAIADSVWGRTTRTLSAISDSAGVGTLLSRITGLVRTKTQDDAADTTITDAIAGLNDFDPATDTVARVALVDTTTSNADMRGTDGANTVTPLDATQTQAAAAAALNAYDPPTRAESTADKEEVIAAVSSAGDEGGLYPAIVLTPEQAAGATGSTITIVQGDDYTGIRKLPVEISTEADLTGQYMVIAISRNGTRGYSFRGQVYTSDAKQFFNVELTKTQTSKFATGPWDYIIRLEAAIDAESQISKGIWQVDGFTTPQPIQGTART